MRTYKIYLIRHGFTQGNLEGRYIGRTDLPLCPEASDKIKELVETCEYPSVGKVYSSPLKRCVQTSALIYPQITPVFVDNLIEYDFGEYENKKASELADKDEFKRWMNGEGLEGAEDIKEFHSRIIDGINSVIIDMMKRKISDAAVFTHGGVIMQLLSACGLPKRSPTDWAVENGKGYTLLVNASLWGNNKTAEVFTAIPYDKNKELTSENSFDIDTDEI